MPEGAEFNGWRLRQGNTEVIPVAFVESQVPQSGSDLKLKLEHMRTGETRLYTMDIAAVVSGDPFYNSSKPKWKGTVTLAPSMTRALPQGTYRYEVELWRGGGQQTYLWGLLTVLEGINPDA